METESLESLLPQEPVLQITNSCRDHCFNYQFKFNERRIKNVIALAFLTVVFVTIYHREILITKLYPEEDIPFIIPEQQTNSELRVNKTDLRSVTNKTMFVDVKDIKQSVRNIFFTETTCGAEALKKSFSDTRKLILKPRQVCAIESTALTNPEHYIYILYTCPLDGLIYFPDYAKSIVTLPNIFIVQLNLTEFFNNTPVQDLYKSRTMETSSHPKEHFSDLLRYIVLWKFGGTYLDLDVVTIKSLLDLGSNFAGVEDWSVINSAVLNVDSMGNGHELVQKALQYVNKHFDGNGWISNGPEVLTKMILKECNKEKIDEELLKCDKFHLFPSTYFYHIHWTREEDFFNSTLGPDIVEDLKNHSYVVHMWNKISNSHVVKIGSNQAYGLLAEEFCPNVIENSGGEF
ncbi:lactosylceramide 4-alpha-galactosyltransferase-like [Macrosteles quadrilineatus]|uniref:lactosylceramide 4-alpha-galactosyltransferase-like n=1 Tax=Macrosteles quadrilineatus TaxID=74068 RepID=UPI0023E2F68A|nr:lactosylceramide 4-alpha-galactosyltransferase-like [Macrosteles quadrilineatus]XP_054271818.1 lactosylceramide 4-alpha-galactosyltransferase-like [Macrosteles quadrilineatus]XP_054271820.1 lactosylceramide 4-alpha-galactosyltransferase-like [Macrosteles quadrilineatus]